MIREYARQRGLRRWLISVPVLTPYLSSLWQQEKPLQQTGPASRLFEE